MSKVPTQVVYGPTSNERSIDPEIWVPSLKSILPQHWSLEKEEHDEDHAIDVDDGARRVQR